jgi:hypothetical protein
MPIDKTEEPTPEEKCGPAVLRYLSDEKGAETVNAADGLDAAIERLCNELSKNDGPLEQLRLLQEAEDEWAALRALLPEKEMMPPAWEDRPVLTRMEETLTRQRVPPRKAQQAPRRGLRNRAETSDTRAAPRREEESKLAAFVTNDADLRSLLKTLDPNAQDTLRRILIQDQPDRDAIASQLMRYRDQNGDDWADIIDFLTMHPDARRRVVRLLGEIEAGDSDAAEL